MVKSNKVYHLRKGLLVIVAVVLSITLVIPGFSYGEEGRKLQFICFKTQSTAQDEWYQYFRNADGTEVFGRYDALSPTGIPVNNNNYFNVKVWNDGVPITDTSLYKTEWSVFDPDFTNPFLKYSNNLY